MYGLLLIFMGLLFALSWSGVRAATRIEVLLLLLSVAVAGRELGAAVSVVLAPLVDDRDDEEEVDSIESIRLRTAADEDWPAFVEGVAGLRSCMSLEKKK